MNCHQYVDDTKLHLVLPADPRETVETEQVSETVLELMRTNKHIGPKCNGGASDERKV